MNTIVLIGDLATRCFTICGQKHCTQSIHAKTFGSDFHLRGTLLEYSRKWKFDYVTRSFTVKKNFVSKNTLK